MCEPGLADGVKPMLMASEPIEQVSFKNAFMEEVAMDIMTS